MPLYWLLIAIASAREPSRSPATWSGPPPLRPTATLETPNADAADRLGVGVTVHVLLQVHSRPTDDGVVETPESRACRDQAVSTVLGSRVRTVVAEGHLLGGTFDAPTPIDPSPESASIGATLAGFEGVVVYGFERPDMHGRSTRRMAEMRTAAEGMTALRTASGTDAEKLARLDELQRSFYAANTEFVVGTLPMRSYLALETALAVAAHRDVRDVFLVIGRSHWPDFPHALQTSDRLGNDRFVGLRVVRYDCT